jgi:hypothetical protein
MKVQVLMGMVLMLAGVAHAGSTGAITLENKSNNVLTMYGGDTDHSCNANPGGQCTIELEPGDYNVLIVLVGTDDVIAKTLVTVESDKEQVLTITEN